MGQKTLVTIGMIVGSIIGGYIPSFFGIGPISYTAVITSSIGAILGVWIGYRLGDL